MVEVFVGIGSNVDARRYIRIGLEALTTEFGALRLSPVFESEPVGFPGTNFLNLVASFDTARTVAEVAACLRRIEDDNGRRRDLPRFSPRTLDIDLLTYADWAGDFDGIVLPREEILHNAFVLWPLAELAPAHRHPETGQTYAELWAAYDKSQQRLWRVEGIERLAPSAQRLKPKT